MSVPKIVVFDLDETLGYFSQIGVMWSSLHPWTESDDLHPTHAEQMLFNDTLDLYPEFIRPDINNILRYVYDKKMSGDCDKMMIYTNNKRNSKWVHLIKSYFDYALGLKNRPYVFDQIIQAFKINGKIVEVSRTTKKKLHNDLIACTKMPLETQICFLDDMVYAGMNHNNVYYINFEPYVHHLPFSEIVDRFSRNANNSPSIHHEVWSHGTEETFRLNTHHSILDQLGQGFSYKKKPFGEYEMDKIISRHMLEKIKMFFKLCDNGKCGRLEKIRVHPRPTKRRSKHKKNSMNTNKYTLKTRKRKKIW